MTDGPAAPRTCQVAVNWDGEPPWCGKPVAARCTFTCECKKHSNDRFACADDKAHLSEEEWVCGPCEEGPDPHECVLIATFGPLGGSGD